MKANDKLNSVHCMRFVAALAVVVHHVTTGLGNQHVLVGAAGVDVFFVISGIVIGLALIKHESAGQFATKRIIRVLPMYWLATAVYAFFRYHTWGEPQPLDLLWRSFLLIPHFGSNWHVIYFPAWTLMYEMLFYAVATAALIAYRQQAFVVCMVLFGAIGLLRIPVPSSPTDAIFSTGICLEFCAGMAIAQLVARGKRVPPTVGALCVIAGIALLWTYQSAVLIIQEDPHAFHLARPLELGVGATLLLLGALSFERARIFENRWLQLGGAASYSIYLTHIITLDFTGVHLDQWGMPAKAHPVFMSCVLIVESLAVGVAIHKLIEVPVLDWLKRACLPSRRNDEPHVSVSLSAGPAKPSQ
ncbi:acyltransferase family protein [Paraburkholderia phosphatilytica]|uniref:acyltransferase family protein n=1 Tax=Paraburkholderia phosphatilytica TaxID=2282883 RepID=UPI0013E0E3C6|nr:acyltransferase [Paraburkholderia phosphatilytica]